LDTLCGNRRSERGRAVAWPQYDPATEGMLQLDDTFTPINGYHTLQCTYLETLTQP